MPTPDTYRVHTPSADLALHRWDSSRPCQMHPKQAHSGSSTRYGFRWRIDEQESRLATRLSVPQHFAGLGWRLQLGFGHANTIARFSVAVGCLSGNGPVVGDERSLRRQMEGEPVQEQTHRRNEG